METLTTEKSDRENVTVFGLGDVLGGEGNVLLASSLTDEEWLHIINEIIRRVKPQLKYLPCFKPIAELVCRGSSIEDIKETMGDYMIPDEMVAMNCIELYSRITTESDERVSLEKYCRNPPLTFSRDVWMLSKNAKLILCKSSYKCTPRSVESLEYARSNFEVRYRATKVSFFVLDKKNLLENIKIEKSAIARCLAEKLKEVFSEKHESIKKNLDDLQGRKDFLEDIVERKINWDERSVT